MLEPTSDPAWVLEQVGYDALRDSSRQSRFTVSNGFLGVRGGRTVNRQLHGLGTPYMLVAGLFETIGTDQPIPGLVQVPSWLRAHLSTPAGVPALHSDDSHIHRRTLDLRRGVLLTEGRLSSPSGLVISVRVLRLVSMSDRSSGLQLIQFEIEAGAGEVTLQTGFDGLDFGLNVDRLDEDRGVWHTTRLSHRLAIADLATLTLDGATIEANSLGPFSRAWKWHARAGQILWFERMVAVACSSRDVDPIQAVETSLHKSRTLGSRNCVSRHEAAWTERWRCSDVRVEGDPGAQQALRFACYHLNGAADPGNEYVSIAARGLTGNDYHGHVFWDTEIFLLPFYSLTWPEAARVLLMYRFHTLDQARAKARRLGYRGALYAWESADTGAEATPEHAIAADRQVVDILCGTLEQHIGADVAYAVWQYWQATGDEAFLRDAGAEILLESGRFWSSRAILEGDGLCHIQQVIGPDEYHERVDDNAYTNVMARWTIRRAIETATLLRSRWPECWSVLAGRLVIDDSELAQWSTVADTIVTGLDVATGLYEQFGGFFGLDPIDLSQYAGPSVPIDVVLGRERTAASQIVKQADVVALLALLPDEFDASTAAVNFDYYEPRCSHGSSLSRTMHALAAARMGSSSVALSFFRESAEIDLGDTKVAVDGGIHMAALGGSWLTAIFGFAGLSLLPAGLGFEPQLPSGWESLSFSVQWRGRQLSISIRQSDGTLDATLDAGEPMLIVLCGKQHEISRAGETRTFSSRR
ncbi:glycoside hydrolase family 65 protein [Lichenicola cladoniae]|uniref:glycoside hydrolase family 65 protein n=1 Tax=Lichenicola cladoniae TaxID=1484109 RepID=UPI001EF5BF4C|nr:glycosyl hydrolase family 65 protein [Lichenicola cladoniae]